MQVLRHRGACSQFRAMLGQDLSGRGVLVFQVSRLALSTASAHGWCIKERTHDASEQPVVGQELKARWFDV
jgi:hypothetical protein